MSQSYFRLRWESTGDHHWWYVSPIDLAAANGQYDLVRELLHLDPNHLIKLTSLRRIRRLESVWDDDAQFADAAKCRAFVARSLFTDFETKINGNRLLDSGYGGWLIYTAASAGDVGLVQELLDRDPVLVFGEGEFGVTDILYAASRSKNPETFNLLYEFALSPRFSVDGQAGEALEASSDCGDVPLFRWEIKNRAVHAAARGGNLMVLRDLLHGCDDVAAYRDVEGSTLLHTAAGGGHIEVVSYLIASFDVINSVDNHGNTALHVAAHAGHLAVVEFLISSEPSLMMSENNHGDTFLHTAVTGFMTPGFRRLDHQLEFMKQLMNGKFVGIGSVANARNCEGRTMLHMSVVYNLHTDLIELLLRSRGIDFNIRDVYGMTPLDLLGQRPRSAYFDLIAGQFISAGAAVSSMNTCLVRPSTASSLTKLQAVGNQPGSLFKIPDSEIFLYTGLGTKQCGGRRSSYSICSKIELPNHHTAADKQESCDKRSGKHINILLGWPRRRGKCPKSMNEIAVISEQVEDHIPLRQRFAKTPPSVHNSKRTLAVRNPTVTTSHKKRLDAGLVQEVMHTMPHVSFFPGTTTTASRQKQERGCDAVSANCSRSTSLCGMLVVKPYRCFARPSCFRTQGLTVEDSVTGKQSIRLFKRPVISVA